MCCSIALDPNTHKMILNKKSDACLDDGACPVHKMYAEHPSVKNPKLPAPSANCIHHMNFIAKLWGGLCGDIPR
ncbi:MAG: hypothetical protein LBB23_02860 [Rickettsiales bacterium]|jgi:hypothetical protein|nr:hypothetical protein [Rickettsiales bacterium]